MFQLLKSVVKRRFVRSSSRRPAQRLDRSARLGVESLEDRLVLNSGPITNLAGADFFMTSSRNQTQHVLVIQQQTDFFIPPNFRFHSSWHFFATFTGTWDGVSVTGGSLNWDAAANTIDIAFSWAGGHTFTTGKVILNGPAGSYGISGVVHVTGGGGPGSVAGNEVPFLEDKFSLTDQGGNPHTLIIQSQFNTPENPVSIFNGTWDGHTGSGTLSVNPNGQVILTFSWMAGANKLHTLKATLTAEPGDIYFLLGQVTVSGGGGPGEVFGLS